MDDASKSLLLKAHHHAKAQLMRDGGSDASRGDQEETLFLPPNRHDHPMYDLIVANILAAPLMTLAPELHRLLLPGGKVGLSGILAHQGEELCAAFCQAGFVNVQVGSPKDGWLLVTAEKAETL